MISSISYWIGKELDDLVNNLVRISKKNLGNKYSVDIKYVLNRQVEEEFHRCIEIAMRAFLNYLDEQDQLQTLTIKNIAKYIQSDEVTEEISHLLDPGLEFFDRGQVTQAIGQYLEDKNSDDFLETTYQAWEEFLKAFSFASRSASHLREFLRASYEAGSFKILSNIEDVLMGMYSTVNYLEVEENKLKQSVSNYVEDLKSYKNWALDFPLNDKGV